MRRLSKTVLAADVGVSAAAVTQYEKGIIRPTAAVLAAISLRLGLDKSFFGAGRPLQSLPAASAHFRSLRSTTAIAREQALAYGELGLELTALIEQYIELPSPDLPAIDLPPVGLPEDLPAEEIREVVQQAKAAWDIGPGPVAHVVRLLEAHGVLVLRLPETIDRKVDAFSSDAGYRPLVMLNPGKDDKARSRFDAGHELGHLLLHPDNEPGSKLLEQQADAFAAEFLMPRDEIIDQLPRRVDWPAFHELKRHWGVSLRALIYRAHVLGTLSESSYRRANQRLAAQGHPEPGPLGPPESPTLLGSAVSLLSSSGISLRSILEAGRLDPIEAEQVIEAGSETKPRVSMVSS